jgi:hypothetical protein
LTITGWWLTYPSEKYESQLRLLLPIYGKIIQMSQTTNQIVFIMGKYGEDMGNSSINGGFNFRGKVTNGCFFFWDLNSNYGYQ